MKNTVLVTHKNCMDGSGCVIAFIHAGGKRENVHFVNPNDVDKLVYDNTLFGINKKIIIADLCVSKNAANFLEKRCNVNLFDHHKTAKHLSNKSWCNIDITMCGCKLLFKYLDLHGYYDKLSSESFEQLTSLIDMINDRDMWIRKIKESDNILLYSMFFGQKRFIDRFITKFNFPNDEDNLILNVLKEKRIEDIKYAIDHVSFSYLYPNEIGIIYTNNSQDHSLILNELLKFYDDIAIAVGIDIQQKTVSLRSRGNIDVSKIAKKYGGGGHGAAAGHKLDDYLYNELIEGLY